jgi:type II secretory pathway component PulF
MSSNNPYYVPPPKEEPKEYLQAIESSITNNSVLLNALEDAVKIAPWLSRDPQTVAIKSALSGSATPLDFLSQSHLAASIPLLLMAKPSPSQEEYDLLVQRMRTFLQHAYRRRWIWQIFSYPVFLIVAYVIAWVLASVLLLPLFQELYKDLRKAPSNLHWIQVSELWITNPIWATIRTLLICTILFGAIKSIPLMLEYGSRWWVIGIFARSSKRQLLGMARFTGTLAALLKIGTPESTAIRVSGLASGYHLFHFHAKRAADLRDAAPTGVAVSLPACFPKTLDFALRSTNGKIEVDLIEQLSRIYTRRWERRIELGRNLAGPVATVFGGFFIGGLYSNLMLPLLQFITALSGTP